MPRVYPSQIVSFSSEDPNHPCCNLLKKDSFRKWKCREQGEKEAVVIFKLDKVEILGGFNVCNENSAFIEIFVARSAAIPVKYESILSQSQLMSPTESRNGENTSSVRFFSAYQLNKVTAAEKWDLVKVVCCQPFNRHVQYGLSSVEFNTVPDSNEKTKIGVFGLRSEPLGDGDGDESPIVVGSLFKKLKRNSDEANKTFPTSQEEKISSSSTDIRPCSATTLKPTIASKVNENNVMELTRKHKLDANKSIPKSGDISVDFSVGKSTNNRNSIGSQPPSTTTPTISLPSSPVTIKNNNVQGKSSPTVSSVNHSISSIKRPNKTTVASPKATSTSNSAVSKSKRQERPFDKLFEGVVFVMSGFENPHRTEIRNMALEMGARFQGDWNSASTHLLCAFVNTPKFRQVKSSGRGKIVKKEWVEASFSAKCRFPWRRYCLDRDDKGQESEEEIYAVTDQQVALSQITGSRSGHKTCEDEMEEPERRKRKRVMIVESDEETSESEKKDPVQKMNLTEMQDEAYLVDTDIDEEENLVIPNAEK